MENERRNHKITFRMNDEEYEIFQQKFKMSGGKSQGDFIRKMLMKDVILHIEKEKFNSISRNIFNASANVNQIVFRVNSTGNIYADDIENLCNNYQNLIKEIINLRDEINNMANATKIMTLIEKNSNNITFNKLNSLFFIVNDSFSFHKSFISVFITFKVININLTIF